MRNKKPITIIGSDKGIRYYNSGLYRGKTRDLIIPNRHYGFTISINPNIDGEDPFERVDEMFMYLSANIGSPGYEFLESVLKNNKNIQGNIVTCRCKSYFKEDFAERLKIPIIWSECGGRETIEKLVRDKLR